LVTKKRRKNEEEVQGEPELLGRVGQKQKPPQEVEREKEFKKEKRGEVVWTVKGEGVKTTKKVLGKE